MYVSILKSFINTTRIKITDIFERTLIIKQRALILVDQLKNPAIQYFCKIKVNFLRKPRKWLVNIRIKMPRLS